MHRGDPAVCCAESGGQYQELVLEGNQGKLKCGFRLTCTKGAVQTVLFTEIVVIPCLSCLPIQGHLYVLIGVKIL